MNKYSELIDQYFSNEMGHARRKDFERQLETDLQLKAEFDQQAQVLKGIEIYAIKNEVQLGFKRKARKIKAGRWLAAITIATLLVLTALVLKDESAPVEAPAIRAAAPTPPPLKSAVAEPAAAEKMSPREIKPSENKNRKGPSFVWSKAKGNNLPQSVAAGPLADRQKPSRAAAAPNQNVSSKAAVFGSNKQQDGKMGWKNMGSLDQGRIMADSMALDAYSRYLQDTVKNADLVVRDKKLTDSLYRSFRQSAAAKEYLGKDTAGVVFLAIVKKPSKSAAGAALFRQNCASCHSLGAQKIKGPGLEGVMGRVPGGDWLFNYILNSQRMIGSGNAYANKIYNEHGRTAMTVFEGKLSEPEIRSIIDFLGHLPATGTTK